MIDPTFDEPIYTSVAPVAFAPRAVYPADGETFGEADGYDCNSEMIDNADALILFRYGVGREVRKMIETAWKFDLELHEIEI